MVSQDDCIVMVLLSMVHFSKKADTPPAVGLVRQRLPPMQRGRRIRAYKREPRKGSKSIGNPNQTLISSDGEA
jgi:hypothetical protein